MAGISKHAGRYIRSGLPSFDRLTGGGIPCSRVFEIYGDPDVGKSTLAFHLIKAAQAHGRALYVDFEEKLDDKYMYTVGVDPANIQIEEPSYGEEGLDKILEVLDAEIAVLDKLEKVEAKKRKTKADEAQINKLKAQARKLHYSLVVIDSVAEITPLRELKAAKLEKDSMALNAKLMAQFCRVIGYRLLRTGTALMGINQARDNIGGFGGRPKSPGGRAWHHKCGIRVYCTRAKLDPNPYEDGSRLNLWRIKNNINSSMIDRASFNIERGVGIDIVRDYASVAEDAGILEKLGGGRWAIGKKEFNGRLAAGHALQDSEAFARFLDTGEWG